MLPYFEFLLLLLLSQLTVNTKYYNQTNTIVFKL
jgi:hypothetical protein